MKLIKEHKIFLLAVVLSLIIPLVFALQAGFLEVKTLCINGDCRVVWPNGAGDVNVTLDDAYSVDANRGIDANINVELTDLIFHVSGQSQPNLTFPEIIFETQSPLGLGVSDSFITFKITGEQVGGNVGTFRIVDGAGDNIVLIETARTALAFPVFQSVQWEPIDDNTFDLGATDRRWRDLFLAGTIKGQGSPCDPELGCSTNFVFDLNGASGDFDTVGDLNSFDILIRSDLNNNASDSDANFNRAEADFFFGNGAGITGIGFTTDTTLDTNTNARTNFLARNNLFTVDQSFATKINTFDFNAEGNDINFSKLQTADIFTDDFHISSGGRIDTIGAVMQFESDDRFEFDETGFGQLFQIDGLGLIVGDQQAGVDWRISFQGENSAGLLTYMEDEARFQWSNDVRHLSVTKETFRDDDINFFSSVDGVLNVNVDGTLDLVTPDFNVTGNQNLRDGNLFIDVNQGICFNGRVCTKFMVYDGNILVIEG